MNILITGNMGYVGPAVVKQLRSSHPGARLIGVDMGYFAHCLTAADTLPECGMDVQYFMDVRDIGAEMLAGVDAIIHLAAISNDPMGNAFEEVTLEINHRATVALAEKARKAGVRRFVFASSCSVYGFAEGGARAEGAELNPLTAYAKSKVYSERDLKELAGEDFIVTSLRFATACGMSDRLRLDLVLNDFVANAVATKKIVILSDGTPWRPLITVQDMALALDWAATRPVDNGGGFIALNVGSNTWNYQVRALAEAVAREIPGVEVTINKDAAPDKRSYQVNFDLFAGLAPGYQPKVDLAGAIAGLKEGLTAMRFKDANFRQSSFMRLKVLQEHLERGRLTRQLRWS
ncbi:MAG: SDR family oxidoreductase [Gammaproteobacteria bacterium]|nr:SDR family oxidoreductase [Gammaproteobacteria bacterium]